MVLEGLDTSYLMSWLIVDSPANGSLVDDIQNLYSLVDLVAGTSLHVWYHCWKQMTNLPENQVLLMQFCGLQSGTWTHFA